MRDERFVFKRKSVSLLRTEMESWAWKLQDITDSPVREIEELMFTPGLGPFLGVRTIEWARGYIGVEIRGRLVMVKCKGEAG